MGEDNLITSNFTTKYVNDNDRYPEFRESIKSRFNSIAGNGIPLFTTDSEGLFDLFLDSLPQEARQHYTCKACRNFVNRYGGLVTVSDNGEITSVLWDGNDTPEFFAPSVKAIKNIVLKSKITGVFLSENNVLGQPIAGNWNHMSVTLPSEMVFCSRLKNAGQEMAEKKEDYRILIAGLLEYSTDVVEQAVTLLKTESLYRSEKCLGVAEWLKDIHTRRSNNSRNRDNIAWLAVATAPPGFCHIKSSMIGTLLDDIAAGLSYESVSRRFAEKMHPLHYQRPQAAPSAGNIAQAEKIVEKLGIQKSFVRRFARLDEIEKVWTQKEERGDTKRGGIFSHLVTKNKKEHRKMDVPPITMTWKKFSETVLPFAESIEFLVKNGTDYYSAILTASYEDAPPILQWDTEEKRNPFSWYVYTDGSSYSRWGLSTGYCKVTGVCLQPSMWNGNFEHQGKAVIFILDGAKDKRDENAGNALFPETLKSELREIRSTIEAYSRSASIEGYEEASACGIRLQYGSNWDSVFRVTTNTGTVLYKLDRWD